MSAQAIRKPRSLDDVVIREATNARKSVCASTSVLNDLKAHGFTDDEIYDLVVPRRTLTRRREVRRASFSRRIGAGLPACQNHRTCGASVRRTRESPSLAPKTEPNLGRLRAPDAAQVGRRFASGRTDTVPNRIRHARIASAMRLWRVSEWPDLSGRGGLLTDGRWTRAGIPAVYCADHPATALLEKLVHLDLEDFPLTYKLLAIDVPDDVPAHRIEGSAMPSTWRSDVAGSQAIGMELLTRGEHLFFWVPSALVPYAWNALLNPRHAGIDRCSVAEVIEHPLDRRFVR